MQQSMQMAAMPGAPPANITTEQIQKYLDENKQLILAILENQNLGKLSECAQYQAQLQKNLLYLAAIADAQPQSPSIRPQTPGGAMPAMPPGAMPVLPAGMSPQAAAQYMQQQQMFPQRMPLQESSLQQTPPHQGMGFGGQMGLRPGMAMNGLHHHHPHHHGSMHADPTGKLDGSGSELGDKERSSGGENNDGEK